MAEEKRTIEVTEDEFKMLMAARDGILGNTDTDGEADKGDPAKGLAIGAIAGAGAMLMLEMLLEDEVMVVEAIKEHIASGTPDFTIKSDSKYIVKK